MEYFIMNRIISDVSSREFALLFLSARRDVTFVFFCFSPNNSSQSRTLTRSISRHHYECPLWTREDRISKRVMNFRGFRFSLRECEPLVVRRINPGGASSITIPVLMRFNEGFLSYFQLLFTIWSDSRFIDLSRVSASASIESNVLRN